MTEYKSLIEKLFASQIKHEEQEYPFTGDIIIRYRLDGEAIEREFRKAGDELVRDFNDVELKGKDRNGQLKKLNAGLTSRDSKAVTP